MTIRQMLVAQNLYWGIETPGNISETDGSTLTLTVGSDGSVTCGGYSDRWWIADGTPPTCYVTYEATEGNADAGTTMDDIPDRTATSGSPTIVKETGTVAGTIAIYTAASGGTLLTSWSFSMTVA